MKTKSRHGRRKGGISVVTMLLAGFAMVMWSVAISAGVLSPV
jgi:hypothetical protein